LLGVLGDPDASPGERVRALLMRKPGEALDRDALRRRLPAGLDVAAIADETADVARIAGDPPSWVWSRVAETWRGPLVAGIAAYHEAHPLLDGPTLAEARRLLAPSPDARMFDALVGLLQGEGIELRGHRLALSSHDSSPGPADRVALETFVARLAEGGVHPPTIEAARRGLELPPDSLAWLLERGDLVKVADDFLVDREAFRGLVRRIVAHVRATGVLTPGDFKELAGLSRRHAIPFLEFLDKQRVTVRKGSGRVLRDLPDWA
jgi:selenocysteine-specific elongation factor